MKNTQRSLLTLLCLLLASPLAAQVPQLVNYQGRVVVGGTNFNGAGTFKFALVNSNATPTFWSNNGTSVNGSEPNAAVTLNVVNGLYSVLLGDATLANMTVIPATVFTNGDVRLRVWFNGGAGFQLLTPDQRIAAVGYAMMSANVPDGLITSNKLADGAVTAAKLANGSVTSAKLALNTITSSNIADTIDLGATNATGRLDVYRTSANTPAISLLGSSSQISTYGSDGLEQTRLFGTSYGELLLNNNLSNNATAVRLSAQGSTGGQLELRNTNGSNRAVLEGENAGGTLTLYASDGGIGSVLYGNEGAGSGALSLRNTNGSARVRAYGGPASGSFELYDNDGTRTFLAQAAESSTSGSQLLMYQGDGTAAVQLDAEFGVNGGYLALYSGDGGNAIIGSSDSQGGQLGVYEEDGSLTTLIHNVSNAGVVSMRNPSGVETLYLWGTDSAASGGGQLGLMESDGTETIVAAADGGGNITLRQGDGTTGLSLTADNGTGGGGVSLFRDNGTFAGQFTIADNTSRDGFFSLARANSTGLGLMARGAGAEGGGLLELYQADGTGTLTMYATESGTGGSQIIMRKGNGTTSIQLDAEIGTTGGGYLDIRDAAGSAVIVLNGDTGTMRAQVVEITGGSDLSENFNISEGKDALQPGMIVSIDPKNPGGLALCESAYDKKVAGIISGAGGVQTGMKMGQRGSVADGKHPVALTGRVYCWMDADAGGSIEPGDLITTSKTSGHGMKVADHSRASGAIIGKAMTPLAKGKGLVLVLVSLQ